MAEEITVTLPRLPRSDSSKASHLIDQVMQERNWPTSPQAAARVGFEAAYRMANEQLALTLASQFSVKLSEWPEAQNLLKLTWRDVDNYWVREHARARSAELAMREDVERLLAERHRAICLMEEIDRLLTEQGCPTTHPVRALISKSVNPFHANIFPFVVGKSKHPCDEAQPQLVREDNRDISIVQNDQVLGVFSAGSPGWQAIRSAVGNGFIPPRGVTQQEATAA